jgi:ankyrin repeat protein
LHEAARAGHIDVLRLLLEIGSQSNSFGNDARRGNRLKVDINARTNNERGCTALWLAEQNHGADSNVAQFLRNNGGVSIGGIFEEESEEEDSNNNRDQSNDSEEESIQDEY